MSDLVTVTQGPWGVSVQTSSCKKGATLHVYRFLSELTKKDCRMVSGDADGREFSSSEEAWVFALERGYVVPYRPRASLKWASPKKLDVEAKRLERAIKKARERSGS